MKGLIIGYFVLAVVAIVGWVMNIIEIFNSNFSAIDGELVLRVVGVFVAPIGAVMGYI